MPLPEDNVAWPPASVAEANKAYARYGAWYAGDPEKLSQAYQDVPGNDVGTGSELPVGQFSASPRFMGGLLRGVQRMFWGTPVSNGQIRSTKAHIPLAGDISSTSADLLLGEAPKLKVGGGGQAGANRQPAKNASQERLDAIHAEANVQAVWLEAAELASAYGGSYLRTGWDPVLAEVPLLDAIPPDSAVPEFRGPRLWSVIFWRELAPIDGKRWFHLELHERGRITHGVYRSTSEGKLGRKMDLADHPETAKFKLLITPGQDFVVTGATGLAAEYVPNMRPNREWRGSPLGRSDYSAGVIDAMDKLDEGWTSWMRDLRQGKGRIIVPRTYLQGQGRGRGAYFDAEREVYEAVDALVEAGSSGLALQQIQFQIRVAEHSQTCDAATVIAVRGAGYDEDSFGMAGDTSMTATEAVGRKARSARTTAKKRLYMQGPLARIALAMMEIDVELFGTKGVTPELPAVDWPDAVAIDPETQARTLQMLKAAESASVHRRVEILNPEWEQPDVEKEVIRIKEEQAAGVSVPVEPPGAGSTGHGPDGPATAPGTIPGDNLA